MKQSQLFAKSKKEAPKGAEAVSHQYLIRGDFIDQLSAGVYSFLPLGWRVYHRIEQIIKQEMDVLGGQELNLPTLIPKKLWQETNRWQEIDPPLFIVKDRHKKDFGLGPTHEEVITDLVRQRVSSYADLPLYLYQIQNKFRNEMRATGGLLRVREFMMKDLYSFSVSERETKEFYNQVRKSYWRIFEKCGLKAICAEADSGTIGGSLSHEFILPAEIGEDRVLVCNDCDYGANVEKAGEIKECPKCKGKLSEKNGIEIGHTFFLGTKYSQAMKAEFADQAGRQKPIVMGCYGIGLGRLIAAIVEANHDGQGIAWPDLVAPFDIHLIALAGDRVKPAAEKLYQALTQQGKQVLFDDRDKTAGEKFAEADLIGIPLRMVVSEKTLEKGAVEIKKRASNKTELIKIDKVDKELSANREPSIEN